MNTAHPTLPLQQQVALVTGASRGIGRAIACLLAANGCHVAINYRSDHAAAQETAHAAQHPGAHTLLVQADVANRAQAQAMVHSVVHVFGRLDILVNNAGITFNNSLLAMDAQEIDAVIRTNLLGVVYPTQATMAQMQMQRNGCIINISSCGATKPGMGQAAYAASKGAVEAFSRAMAVELAADNIRVNTIAPGVTVTDMSEPMRTHRDEEVKKRLLLKRYAQPQEIAQAALYLASPAGRYMTGEVLHINGGMKMG